MASAELSKTACGMHFEMQLPDALILIKIKSAFMASLMP
jgi:hypothetical protein